jgi:hypothetical protein
MFTFLKSLFKKMDLVTRIKNILSTLKGDKDALLSENASLKEQLATALANDAADAQSVADAQADAEVARAAADVAIAETARLQSIVDADTAEDAALDALLSSLEAPVVEEAPAAVVEETTEG